MAPGWVAREQDDRATRTSMIRDWRQVEATMALFELKASALRNEGWLEIAPNSLRPPRPQRDTPRTPRSVHALQSWLHRVLPRRDAPSLFCARRS